MRSAGGWGQEAREVDENLGARGEPVARRPWRFDLAER
ncbi:Hypothetical protein DEACI_2291 [Acididesulfobacillus acetoxydans]|uniref:Uncharacterized protein n=1 Tax=Acididesulfobacillus acetoxydans TaxID=1561005 RepID=A0A8S0WP23_9FIRM|nr:Hypothetical protein DEACI_2291 [Acididesulfobacillus acetoxydans]CEJ07111.1 Hypothetical protein DEACI_1569 [Acididesulfobacillus acetoxydans]